MESILTGVPTACEHGVLFLHPTQAAATTLWNYELASALPGKFASIFLWPPAPLYFDDDVVNFFLFSSCSSHLSSSHFFFSLLT